jgi:cadmium resistance protein CadD (predicted permease)
MKTTKEFIWSCITVIIFLVLITLVFSSLSCTSTRHSRMEDLEKHEREMIHVCK